MGYIKSRANGTVQGMYCDICGKEYVRVVSNPNNSSQDMCVKCYNDFYNGGQQKDKQIAELKAENEILKKYETIYYLNQLQASNEDIDKFKQNQIQQSINISDLLKDNTKQVRKEVCEKIRKNIVKYVYGGNLFDIKGFKELLDQIEEGENNEN